MSSFAPVYFGSDGLPVEYGSTDDLLIAGRLYGSHVQSDYHHNAAAGNTGTTYFAGGTLSASRTDGAVIALAGVSASGSPGGASYYTGATGAGAQHRFFDKNLAQQLQVDENGVTVATALRMGSSRELKGHNLNVLGDDTTATTGYLGLCGGYDFNYLHGAAIQLYGITAAGLPGCAQFICGSVAGAYLGYYDKNGTKQLQIDESGGQFTQYVAGGASGLLVYSNRSSNAVALYLSGGSQTLGYTISAGALIQLQGSGNGGHALYYCATTAGASHYFYDKTATAQARVYEGGLLVYGGFGMAGVGPVGRQTGGALSAAATYAANEQSMLNKVYLAMQAFGFLT